MLRVPFLRNLFLLTLVVSICLPLYTLFVLHPSYHEQLVHETEEDSARFATYLVRSLGLENVSLVKSALPKEIVDQTRHVSADKSLFKLRVFSPKGEIIFSTKKDEIGRVNEKDYFHNIVAKGKTYSKTVAKDSKTADGQVVKIDVVETYVPFDADGRFGGAIEVYSNITSRVEQVNSLTLRSTLTLCVVALFLMAAISLALQKASNSLKERTRAEDALRSANLDLERRVQERTSDLTDANLQLTNEIAERTLAQMALSQALEDSRVDREKLDGILRSVAEGILVTDGKINVLHMNAAVEKILNVPLEKALGQPLGELTFGVDFLKKIGQKLNNPESEQRFDFELKDAETGLVRVYQAHISPLTIEEYEDPGVILLIHDVTRDREIEEMKSAFLGMAAHELNTPLTSIVGYSELLSTEETLKHINEQQQRESLKTIHENALALSRLVDDLLDISRIESGQPLALNYNQCNLPEVVRSVVKPYQKIQGPHSFELQAPTQDVLVQADCGRLRQVFHNLVSNAVKYSPDGGVVKIAMECDANGCQVTVADEGIGMTQEQVDHIFDRFYRVDSSNTAVQGVGLGMSIVHHIVEAHHGHIRVESELGQGTVVKVSLPTDALGEKAEKTKFALES